MRRYDPTFTVQEPCVVAFMSECSLLWGSITYLLEGLF